MTSQPTIIINGETKTVGKINARLAAQIMAIAKVSKNTRTLDFVDNIIEILSKAYNVSVEDILDNVDADALIEKHTELYAYVVKLLFIKTQEEESE